MDWSDLLTSQKSHSQEGDGNEDWWGGGSPEREEHEPEEDHENVELVSTANISNSQRHVSIIEGDMRHGDDDESSATPKADDKSRRSSTKSDGDGWMNLDAAEDDDSQEGSYVNALVEAVITAVVVDDNVGEAAAPTSISESNTIPTVSNTVVAIQDTTVETPSSSASVPVSHVAANISNSQRHVSIVEGDMRHGDDDESSATPKADDKSRRSSTKSDGDGWMNLDAAEDDDSQEGSYVNALVEAVITAVVVDDNVGEAAAPTSISESNVVATASSTAVASDVISTTTDGSVMLPIVGTPPHATLSTPISSSSSNNIQETEANEFEDTLPTTTPAIIPILMSTPRADSTTNNTTVPNTGTPVTNQQFDEFFDLSDNSEIEIGEEDIGDADVTVVSGTLIFTRISL